MPSRSPDVLRGNSLEAYEYAKKMKADLKVRVCKFPVK
jgi:hypothetical protein